MRNLPQRRGAVAATIAGMSESEKRAAEIDIAAAGVNAEAARIALLVDEQVRSAEASKRMSQLASGPWVSGDAENDEERIDRERHADAADEALEVARALAFEAQRVRDAAGGLQRLASRHRRPSVEA